MNENVTVTNIAMNGRYKVNYEIAPSATRNTPGMKVEAHGDDIDQVLADAKKLKRAAELEIGEE